MPEPVTVWMVKLERGGDLREIKGTLRMDEDAVVFVDRKDGAETRVSFGATRKVKRVFGSPVMVLHWRDGDGARSETAFYFVQPPPVRSERGDAMSDREALQQPRPTIGSVLRPPSRRRQRRESIGYLAARSREAKTTIRVWAEEIRTRIRA
jgi:hypothetical protein